MHYYDVKRFALVLAVQAEIEGMKLANSQQDYGREPYTDNDFKNKAEELRILAHKHDDEL